MIDQGELFVIPNPCRGVCTVNNRGYCKGCLRNRNERFYWNEFSPFHQQLIINTCEKRRLKIIAAKNAQPEEPSEEIIPQLDMFTELVSQTPDLEIPQPEVAELISQAPPKKQSRTASKPANTSSQGDDQFDLF